MFLFNTSLYSKFFSTIMLNIFVKWPLLLFQIMNYVTVAINRPFICWLRLGVNVA